VLAGTLDAQTGRWELVSIVERLRIAEAVATRYLGADPGGCRHPNYEAVLDRLRNVVCDRIVSTGPAALDLKLLAEGSKLTVWAFSFARGSVGRIKANLPGRELEVPHPEMELISVASEDLGADDAAERLRCEQIADAQVMPLLHGARGTDRTNLRAIFLRQLYGFPALPRATDHPHRERRLAIVDDYESSERVRRAPGELVELFGDWPEEARNRLVVLDPRAVVALAACALTPVSPPGELARASMAKHLEGRVGDPALARRMAEAAIAAYCETDCSVMHPGRRPRVVERSTRARARRRWGELVDSLDDRQRAALGTDADTALEDLWLACHQVGRETRRTARKAPSRAIAS
jgi:hypothetical protein